jgi:hypothetical protein
MLITHVKPSELWGKQVRDTNGRVLGVVVAIGSRRGLVRKVVVRLVPRTGKVTLVTPADTQVDGNIVTLPNATLPARPQLRVVR